MYTPFPGKEMELSSHLRDVALLSDKDMDSLLAGAVSQSIS